MKRELRKIFRDIPIKVKVQIVVGFLTIAFVGCFCFGILQVSRAANDNLLSAATASLSGAGSQISHKLETLTDISYMILADHTVQDSLVKVKLRDRDYIKYRRSFEAMHNIVQHYQNQFAGSYIDFIGVVNDHYASYSASPYVYELPEEVVDHLRGYAMAASGGAAFVTDYIGTYGLFLVREIREIDDLSLRSLGFMILCIDLDELVRDTAAWTGQYGRPAYYIFDGDRLIYSSPAEEDPAARPHDFGWADYLIDVSGESPNFVVKWDLALTGWKCEICIPYGSITHSIKMAATFSFIVLVVGLTLVVLLSNRILDAIGERMYRVNEKMRMFGEDHHNLPDPPADYYYGKDEIGCLDRQFDRMAHQICDLIDKNYVSELLRKDAELETLEKQINPHFLYNTLESVNWRAKAIGETQISAMTEALGHLLHITLSKSTDIHTMKTELELVRYFMTIQNIRFEGQLDYAQTVDAKSENALIPKLTIQPLIENAVHYGMESGDDVCHIRLAVTLQDKELCIRVSNTGSQFPDNFFEALQKKQYTARGFGIGLLNIDQRLRINFGQPYRIRFYNEDDWAIVEMHIPYLPFKEDA